MIIIAFVVVFAAVFGYCMKDNMKTIKEGRK